MEGVIAVFEYQRVLLADLAKYEGQGWVPANVDEGGAIGVVPAGGGLGVELLVKRLARPVTPLAAFVCVDGLGDAEVELVEQLVRAIRGTREQIDVHVEDPPRASVQHADGSLCGSIAGACVCYAGARPVHPELAALAAEVRRLEQGGRQTAAREAAMVLYRRAQELEQQQSDPQQSNAAEE